MNEINPNRFNRINFKGIRQMGEEKEQSKTLDRYFEDSLQELLENYDNAIPEYGEFSPYYVQFANPDESLSATDFMLKITKPPKTVGGHEKIRNLEIVAYKLPLPYKAGRIVATGNKQDLKKHLQNPELIEKFQNVAKSLSDSLEDV